MIKEYKTEKLFCDFCKKRISPNDKMSICLLCKKDVCFECSVDIIKKIKIKTYSYQNKKIARLCNECFKKMVVKK